MCFEPLVKHQARVYLSDFSTGIIMNKRNFRFPLLFSFVPISTQMLVCDRNEIFLHVFQRLLLQVSITIYMVLSGGHGRTSSWTVSSILVRFVQSLQYRTLCQRKLAVLYIFKSCVVGTPRERIQPLESESECSNMSNSVPRRKAEETVCKSCDN